MTRKLFPLLVAFLIVSLTVFAQNPVTRSEGVIRSTAIKIEDPVYPTMEKIRVEGKVEVEIVISEQGDVMGAVAKSGPQLLRAAAVQAALKSKFRPTLLSGVPVKVSGILTFTFTLDKSDAEKSAKPEKSSSADYAQLLERVKKGDQTVDFTELRMAYAETSEYDPYGPSRTLLNPMFAAINDDKFQQSIELAEKILDKDYVSIDAHMVVSSAYDALKNKEKTTYHRFIVKGLIDSILKSGDGKSMETAMVVISTREEYMILRVKGLDPTGQALLHQGGHSFDKLSAIDPKTKETSEFYFQIDRVFGHWDKIFKKDKPSISQ